MTTEHDQEEVYLIPMKVIIVMTTEHDWGSVTNTKEVNDSDDNRAWLWGSVANTKESNDIDDKRTRLRGNAVNAKEGNDSDDRILFLVADDSSNVLFYSQMKHDETL